MRFRWRTLNVHGRKVQSELEWWEAHRDRVRATGEDLLESYLAFMSAGLRLQENLEAIVHDEDRIDPDFDNRTVAHWLRVSLSARRRIGADLPASVADWSE